MKRTVIAFLFFMILFCLTGCQKNPAAQRDNSTAAPNIQENRQVSLDDYLASIRAQSDAIKASLEQDDLTQTDMNQKSQDLLKLWEAALNDLLAEAEKILPANEMEKLTAEQNAWLEAKEKAITDAGQEYIGGSMHALIVNSEAAKLTEARVDEISKLLK